MRNLKNRTVEFYSFWTFAVLFLISAMAFQQEKKYTVTLTLNEWQAVVNSIDSKQISSLIERQIVPQLDTVKKK